MAAFGLIAAACVTVTSEDLEASPASSPAVSPAAGTSATPSDETSVAAEPSPSANPDPTPEPTPTPRAVGYIALDSSQAYVQSVSSGVRAAADAADLELVECDSGWTRPGVQACARQLADAGVEGIISMQPFSDLTAEVCETTGGVPTVGIVYDQGPCQVSLLQVDQAESGRLAGAALGALAADRFECDVKAYVALESGADDPIGGARMEGFRAGYKESCPLPKRKVRLQDAQFEVKAQTKMGEVLDDISGKPIIAAGVSDAAALGALAAAAEADRPNHVWAAGQLAEAKARDAIACDQRFVASVEQFPERFGEVAMPTLLDAMDGEPVPAQLDAELGLVTSENVRELFPDTASCDA